MDRGYVTKIAILVAMATLCVGVSGAAGQSFLSTPDPGYAQPYAGQQVSATSVSFDSADLARRIQVLETSMAAMAEETAEPEWVQAPQRWTSSFGGRIIWHYLNFASQSPNNLAQYGDQDDYNEFREVRLHFAGTGFENMEYKVEMNLEPEGKAADSPYVQLTDAFVGIKDLPYFGHVRFGQQKAAFGLDYITSSRFISFMERSPAANFFGGGYRLGIHQKRQFLNESFLLQTGLYFGRNNLMDKEYVGDDQGVRVMVRNVWTPIYENNGSALIHIGAGWQYAKADQSVGIRPVTHEGDCFIDIGSLGCDHYNTGNIELAMTSGPLSVQSEMFIGNFANTSSYGSPNAYGAYVQAGYFLTGEHRTYSRGSGNFGRVKPHTNFWLVDSPGGCDAGWGAWEVAARWDYIDFCDFKGGGATTYPGTMNDFVLGINWWWNPYTRIMLDYIHNMPNTIDSTGQYNSSEADMLGMRFQVDF